jgi:hypothetical protein
LRFALVAASACILLTAEHSLAQAPHPDLVGTWERIALTEPDGTPVKNPPPSFLIFSPDGYYSVTAMNAGRAKVTKDLDAMTRDELLARFGSVVARRGRYTVSGDTVVRHVVAHSDPTLEGSADAELYRIDRGVLILRSGRREARYRRPQ